MKSDNLFKIGIPLINRLNHYTSSLHSGNGGINVYFFRKYRNAIVRAKAGGVGSYTLSEGTDIIESGLLPDSISDTVAIIEKFLDED